MAPKEAALSERVQTSFKNLTVAATNLNVASDELAKAITALETALENLTLGISAWATISSGADDSHWWSRDLGYTEINGVWRIALRTSSGDYSSPDDDSARVWLFSSAPRWMQVEAVSRIPDLIEKLAEQAEETRKKIKSKTAQACELAEIIDGVKKSEQDWRRKLRSAFHLLGLQSQATAMDDPDVFVGFDRNQLTVKFPRNLESDISRRDLEAALKHLGVPDLPFTFGFFNVKSVKSDAAKGGSK